MNQIERFTLLCIIAAGAILFLHFSGTALEYSRYNTGWNGTSVFFTMAQERNAVMLATTADLAQAQDSLLLLIEPAGDLTPDEAADCRAFLERGNTIVLAGHGPATRTFLTGIGSGITVSEGALFSLDSAYATPASVIAEPAGDAPLPGTISRLVLNTPHALTGGEPLLESSVFSWVDTNGDGKVNGGESMGSSTVFAREAFGDGRLYVLADPGLFLNGMIGAAPPDNPVFLGSVLTMEPHLLVSQVHTATTATDGFLGWLVFVRNTTIIKIGLLITALGLIALFSGRKQSGTDHDR